MCCDTDVDCNWASGFTSTAELETEFHSEKTEIGNLALRAKGTNTKPECSSSNNSELVKTLNFLMIDIKKSGRDHEFTIQRNKI